MLYLMALAVVTALAFMFWMVAFRLRADRVTFAREDRLARFRFRPENLNRFLLGRSFAVPEDAPEWEGSLIDSLQRARRPAKTAVNDDGLTADLIERLRGPGGADTPQSW